MFGNSFVKSLINYNVYSFNSQDFSKITANHEFLHKAKRSTMLEREMGLHHIITSEDFRNIAFCLQLLQHHLTTAIDYFERITIIGGNPSNLEYGTISSLTYLTNKKEILQSHGGVIRK